MKYEKLMYFELFCILLLFFQACSSSSSEKQKEKVRPAGVKVIKVRKGEISTFIQATGSISPSHESYIGPKVGGRIEKFFADEGDFVEKGSRLVCLEQVRFRLALKEARAAYKESSANLKNFELKLRRKKELFKTGIVDKEMFDDLATDVELVRARADMARSRLEKAEEDMKDSVLYAPFSGFVVERKMNTGEIFSGMSNEYVFHIVDTGTVRVEVNIFETKKKYIKTGQKVSVRVDAIPEKMFAGRITVVNPLVDTASRKFLVKIEMPNPDLALESGMFARVNIPAEKRTQTLLVPAGAVVEREGKKVLFVADAQTAVEKNVTIGLRTHELFEVLDGIKEGDSVIVDGLYSVKNGTPLIIKE